MKSDLKQVFDYLREHEKKLSINQIDFVRSLRKCYNKHGKLSSKQEKILFNIRKFLDNNTEAPPWTPTQKVGS